MFCHCRTVKLPAVVKQSSCCTTACLGGHSSAHVEPKSSAVCHSSRNKKDQDDKDPDILQVDIAEDGIEIPKEMQNQMQKRQVALRGKCFALLDPDYVKVDFSDIMDDKKKENEPSDKKDIEGEPTKLEKPEKKS